MGERWEVSYHNRNVPGAGCAFFKAAAFQEIVKPPPGPFRV